jgi:acyl-CoA thioester hydrolase
VSDEAISRPGIFREEFTVSAEAIDANGHVNNVVFVQWMQDVATRHFEASGGVPLMEQAGAIWVVRSHQIEYHAPVFAGERVQVITWVASFSRVRSLRRYQFLRATDGKLLVRGETDWVFVNASTGRPCSIPEAIKKAFVLVPGANEP